jgi:hypothetical protein
MANLLKYSRNRCTTVEQIDEHTLRSSCRLQDTLTEAFVEITVRLPDLEITGVKGDVYRSAQQGSRDPALRLKKVIGVRVGPGMRKIIKGMIGEETDTRQLAFMVEECCHGVILSFTKDVLESSPRPKELGEAKKFYADMVKENVRLYNRCAAFAPGSSLVEGIEPLE